LVSDPRRSTTNAASSAESGNGAFLRLPEEARRLALDWEVLSGRLPGLTPDLEFGFRFSQRVMRFRSGRYRIGGSMKGGGSELWTPTTESAFLTYEAWRSTEAFPAMPDSDARRELVGLLSSAGVRFNEPGSPESAERHQKKRGAIYRLTLDILRALPFEHLASDRLNGLTLGADPTGGANCSAYENGDILMYSFAINGARRTYIGLLLHELGHPFFLSLSASAVAELRSAHRTISDARALLAIEFLWEKGQRIVNQELSLEEFIAELYMEYSACGSLLRSHIAGQSYPNVSAAWRSVYQIVKDGFGGREYL
jgi:hypothetical protein